MSNNNISKQLKKLDVKKLKMKNGNTVESELRRHSRILANCIMEELDAMYESYSPSVYNRTHNLYNSVDIDNEVKVDVKASGTELSVRVFFDDGATHESFDGRDVNTAYLMNYGWEVKKDVWFKDIYHFGHYEGFHFIEKAIQKYKSKVNNPFKIRVNIGSKSFEE